MAANGFPNYWRSNTYCLAACKQNSPAPIVPHEIPNLAIFKQEKGPLRPLISGNLFYFGTFTSSITICPVIDAFKLIFPVISGADNPFIPFSKMNPRISPYSSLAQTTNISAIGELVIQVLVPFKIYSSPTNLACVFIPLGSDPALGSVRPKQPTISPVDNLWIYLSFCS